MSYFMGWFLQMCNYADLNHWIQHAPETEELIDAVKTLSRTSVTQYIYYTDCRVLHIPLRYSEIFNVINETKSYFRKNLRFNITTSYNWYRVWFSNQIFLSLLKLVFFSRTVNRFTACFAKNLERLYPLRARLFL